MAPPEIADVDGEIPNGVINPGDIIEIGRAFEGSPYPFSDPCSCAGLAPCPPPGAGGCAPAQYVCGDGVLEPGEHCDDGNTTPGDGCDTFCQDETVSGPTMRIVPVDASGNIPSTETKL